ncbi:hypothetical protein [Okeania sp. SIO2G5]|uniref:hypothetical protein n=1 Tax=Okeania sp. SIO2G5 TaxID=2607796 RepID=UPI0013BF7B8C|nr:hypothetical protein [Okeania sp. SIO2G5]NEP76165.1 hypothetical protein [Okeania sp. SIO2G5]
MVYRLNDDIDKTLSPSTMLMSIIVHYSECDNPEGGRWETCSVVEAIAPHGRTNFATHFS